MAKPKLTKKMFADLEKAELREIIVIGMELEPRKAYRFDTAASIKWIQERATDFADVDLEVLGTDCFREGVVDYLTQLQNYILGNSPAPKFPTDEDRVLPEESEVVVEAKVEPAPKKRGRPSKKVVPAETTEEEVVAEAAPPKRKRGRPRKTEVVAKSTKKSGFKVKTPTPTVEAEVPAESGEELVKQEIETTSTATVAVNLSTDVETFASFQASVDSLRAEVQALRTEQTATFNLISDALVYILNNAIIEDDEDIIKDLSQLKK